MENVVESDTVWPTYVHCWSDRPKATLLKKGPGPKGRKKTGRRKEYQGKVVQALIQAWEICGRIRSIRLNPYQPGEQGRGFPDQLPAEAAAH